MHECFLIVTPCHNLTTLHNIPLHSTPSTTTYTTNYHPHSLECFLIVNPCHISPHYTTLHCNPLPYTAISTPLLLHYHHYPTLQSTPSSHYHPLLYNPPHYPTLQSTTLQSTTTTQSNSLHHTHITMCFLLFICLL